MAQNNGHKSIFFTTKKAICDHYRWSDGDFKLFLGLKMPVLRINGRYMGHQENIDNWLKILTAKQNSLDFDESAL